MHPVEIKCHSHSFKMGLNLALTRVGTFNLEINKVIQVVFKMYSKGWAPATIGIDKKVSKRIVLSADLFRNREN